MSALGIGAFVICNQLGVHSQSVDEKLKYSLRVEPFEVNLLSSKAYAMDKGRIYTQVDIHTLITHNDTIIFCSLIEGLTYSLCAQHGETVCHKKDCCVRGSRRNKFNRNFTFLFITTDFDFTQIVSAFSLLYIAIMTSVRVAIVLF